MFVSDNAIGASAVRQQAANTHNTSNRNELSGQPQTGHLADRDISRAVITALERNSLIPRGKVWVGVVNGWVTLKGEVDRNYERAVAVRTVGDLAGVRGVTDKLTLRRRISTRLSRES